MWYTVYDLTIVSGMVENIGAHPERSEPFIFALRKRETNVDIWLGK